MAGIDQNTILMLHMSDDFLDSSVYSHTVENTGVTISDDPTAFTGRCGNFNGKTVLKITTSEVLKLKNSDFTIDFRIKLTVRGGVIGYDTSPSGWASILLLEMNLYSSASGSAWDVFSGVSALSSLPIGTWCHFALVRKGQTFTAYVDGKSVWSGTSEAELFSGGLICIGQQSELAQDGFSGDLQELRVSNTARWSSDFDPPTSPYSALDAPSLFTPSSAISGGRFIVRWETVESATSYTLEQQVDGGDWSQVYTGAGTEYQTMAAGSSMAFRVLAADAEGTQSEYTTSPSIKIFPDLSGKLFGGMIING